VNGRLCPGTISICCRGAGPIECGGDQGAGNPLHEILGNGAGQNQVVGFCVLRNPQWPWPQLPGTVARAFPWPGECPHRRPWPWPDESCPRTRSGPADMASIVTSGFAIPDGQGRFQGMGIVMIHAPIDGRFIDPAIRQGSVRPPGARSGTALMQTKIENAMASSSLFCLGEPR
jgi:hypothetical protein